MANQASNTVYEITVWSAADNYKTGKSDGEPEFFWINEAGQALEAWQQMIDDGYLDAYVTVRKFTRDPWEVQAEYGFDMQDCQPPFKLPKYVQKKVINLLEKTRV